MPPGLGTGPHFGRTSGRPHDGVVALSRRVVLSSEALRRANRGRDVLVRRLRPPSREEVTTASIARAQLSDRHWVARILAIKSSARSTCAATASQAHSIARNNSCRAESDSRSARSWHADANLRRCCAAGIFGSGRYFDAGSPAGLDKVRRMLAPRNADACRQLARRPKVARPAGA
jgi:hypothetical protein